jgi:Tol biopolymer transport system component
LWDIAAKKKEEILSKTFQTQGTGLAWSPDGKLIAYCSEKDGEYVLSSIEISSRKTTEYRTPNIPGVFSPNWSPDQKYLIFSGFDYISVDLYRYEVSTGHLDRLTNNLDSESWASYAQDGKSIYYLEEKSGKASIKKMELDSEGLAGRASLIDGSNLGLVTSFRLSNGKIYFTSNRDKKIFNLFRMDMGGTRTTQLTNSYVDVLSVAPEPDGSRYYACVYQHAEEKLFSFDGEKLGNLEKPPQSLEYLSNSFGNAAKVIPVNPVKDRGKESEAASNFDKLEPESMKEKKAPSNAPIALCRLDVI